MNVHNNQDVVLRYSFPQLDVNLLHNIHLTLRDRYGAEVAKYATKEDVGFNHTDVSVIDAHTVHVKVRRSVMQTLKQSTYFLQIQLLEVDPAFESGYKVHSNAFETFNVVGNIYPTDSGLEVENPPIDLETEVRNIIDRVYGGAAPGGGVGGATPEQVAAIEANTAKRSYPLTDEQKLAGIEPGATVGATAQQVDAIAANTAKKGISPEQESAIAANSAKVGITAQQAADITANNQKRTYPTADESKLAGIQAGATVGATGEQVAAINLNTAKRSYPQADETKLAGIEANATVGATPAQASAISANTAKRTYPLADEQKLAALSVPIMRTEAAAFAITPADAEGYIRYAGATNISVTIPNTLTLNSTVTFYQAGLGVITLVGDIGVTLNGDLKTAGQHKAIQLIKVADNLYDVIGGVV